MLGLITVIILKRVRESEWEREREGERERERESTFFQNNKFTASEVTDGK